MGNSYSGDAKGARQVGLEKRLPTCYKDRLITRRAERNADRSMPLLAPTATTLGFALGGADPSVVLPGPAQTLTSPRRRCRALLLAVALSPSTEKALSGTGAVRPQTTSSGENSA